LSYAVCMAMLSDSPLIAWAIASAAPRSAVPLFVDYGKNAETTTLSARSYRARRSATARDRTTGRVPNSARTCIRSRATADDEWLRCIDKTIYRDHVIKIARRGDKMKVLI